MGPPPKRNRKEYPFIGTVKRHGITIHVENKPGSKRHWKGGFTMMRNHYGEILGSRGTDGDKLDVYVGPVEEPKEVYVVHQNFPKTGKYDEDKVMLGFSTPISAKNAYLKHYDSPKFFGSMTIMSIEDFKKKIFGSLKGEKVAEALPVEEKVASIQTFIDKMSVDDAGRYTKYWNSYAKQVMPGITKTVDETVASSRGDAYTRQNIYDILGRLIKRTENTTHKLPGHANPHSHIHKVSSVSREGLETTAIEKIAALTIESPTALITMYKKLVKKQFSRKAIFDGGTIEPSNWQERMANELKFYAMSKGDTLTPEIHSKGKDWFKMTRAPGMSVADIIQGKEEKMYEPAIKGLEDLRGFLKKKQISHNDIHGGNIFISDKAKPTVIDWESWSPEYDRFHFDSDQIDSNISTLRKLTKQSSKDSTVIEGLNDVLSHNKVAAEIKAAGNMTLPITPIGNAGIGNIGNSTGNTFRNISKLVTAPKEGATSMSDMAKVPITPATITTPGAPSTMNNNIAQGVHGIGANLHKMSMVSTPSGTSSSTKKIKGVVKPNTDTKVPLEKVPEPITQAKALKPFAPGPTSVTKDTWNAKNKMASVYKLLSMCGRQS